MENRKVIRSFALQAAYLALVLVISRGAAAQSVPTQVDRRQAPSHVTFKIQAHGYKNAVGVSALDLDSESVLKTGMAQPSRHLKTTSSRVRSGAFSLLPVSGGSTGARLPEDSINSTNSIQSPRNSLRVLPGKTEQFLRVQKCSSFSVCSDISEVRVGEQSELKISGFRWKFVSLAPLCVDSTKTCEVRIPAWSLAKRARYADGSIASFPTVAVVAQSAEGLVIMDASSGAIWDELPLPSGTDFGVLQSARVFSQGSLALTGDKGSLLLDYSSESAFYFDSEGVSQSDLSIADLGLSRWVRIFSLPLQASERARLLTLAPEFATYDQGILHYAAFKAKGSSLRFEKLDRGILAANVDERKEEGQSPYVILRLLRETNKGVSLRTRTLRGGITSGHNLDQYFPVHSKNVLSYKLMNNSVLQSTTGGLYLLTSQGEVMTSLTGQTGDVQTDGQFGALVKVQNAGQCFWRHYLQNETSSRSFSETGLQWKCQTQAPRFTGSPSSSLVVWSEGGFYVVDGVEKAR